MKNDLIENSIQELQTTKELCKMLMETPHYKRLGPEGIFAIIEYSKTIGIDPRIGLNGGLNSIKGKIEMSSRLMNSLIRQAGHSIRLGEETNETQCVLYGKRADTGDSWKSSYTFEEAKAAKLTSNPSWTSARNDMLFARALSRLARQLFPDVIHGAYIQGEISMDTTINPQTQEPVTETLGEEGALELAELLGYCQSYAEKINMYLERKGIQLKDLPLDHAERIKDRIYQIMHANDHDGHDTIMQAKIESEENFEEV